MMFGQRQERRWRCCDTRRPRCRCDDSNSNRSNGCEEWALREKREMEGMLTAGGGHAGESGAERRLGEALLGDAPLAVDARESRRRRLRRRCCRREGRDCVGARRPSNPPRRLRRVNRATEREGRASGEERGRGGEEHGSTPLAEQPTSKVVDAGRKRVGRRITVCLSAVCRVCAVLWDPKEMCDCHGNSRIMSVIRKCVIQTRTTVSARTAHGCAGDAGLR